MFDTVRHDRSRYEGGLRNPGFWILAVYRFGVWASGLRPALLRWPFWAAYRLARLPLLPFRVHLWAGAHGARVGRGLVLIHPSQVTIGSGVEMGDDCLVFHSVTIGTGPTPGVPKIGSRVDIYVGACVLGGITVGDDVMIGANCVVTRDVPSGSVVLSTPARIMPRSMSPYASAADRREAA